MTERWVSIGGYEGLYEVSDLGRVRSLKRATTSGKILKQCRGHGGYSKVTLSKNNVKTTYTVHRIVARAFLPTVEGKNEVNHISGDKRDNRVENLEWCTRAENEAHAFRNLGKKPTAYWSGRPRKFARKFTDAQVREIRSDDRTSREIAKEYGVSKTTILNIKNRKIYTEVEDVN